MPAAAALGLGAATAGRRSRKGKEAVELSDLEEAIERVIAGPQRRSNVMSEKEKKDQKNEQKEDVWLDRLHRLYYLFLMVQMFHLFLLVLQHLLLCLLLVLLQLFLFG